MLRALVAVALGGVASAKLSIHPPAVQLAPGAAAGFQTEPPQCVEWTTDDSSFALSTYDGGIKCPAGTSAGVYVANVASATGGALRQSATLSARTLHNAVATALVECDETAALTLGLSTDRLPVGQQEELFIGGLDAALSTQRTTGLSFSLETYSLLRCGGEGDCVALAKELEGAPLPPSDAAVAGVLTLRRLADGGAQLLASGGIDLPLRLKAEAGRAFSDIVLLGGGGTPGRVALCVQGIPPSGSAARSRPTVCRALLVAERLVTAPSATVVVAPGTRLPLCLFRLVRDARGEDKLELTRGLPSACTGEAGAAVADRSFSWVSSRADVAAVDEAAMSATTVGTAYAIALDARLAETDPARPEGGYTSACAAGGTLPRGCTDGSNGVHLLVKVETLAGISAWLEPASRLSRHRSLLAALVGEYGAPWEVAAASAAPLDTAGRRADEDYTAATGVAYTTPAVQGVAVDSTGTTAFRCTGHSLGSCKAPASVLHTVQGERYFLHLQGVSSSGARLAAGTTLYPSISVVGGSVALASAPLPAAACRPSTTPATAQLTGYLVSLVACAAGSLELGVSLEGFSTNTTVVVSAPVGLEWPVAGARVAVTALNASNPASGSVSSADAADASALPLLRLPFLASAEPLTTTLAPCGGSNGYAFRVSRVKGLSRSGAASDVCMAAIDGPSCPLSAVTVSNAGELRAVATGEAAVELEDAAFAGNGALLAVAVTEPAALHVSGAATGLELLVDGEALVQLSASDGAGKAYDLCDNLAPTLVWTVEGEAVTIQETGWPAGVRPGSPEASRLGVMSSTCGYVRVAVLKTGSAKLRVTLKVSSRELSATLAISVFHRLVTVFPPPRPGSHLVARGSSLLVAVIGGPQAYDVATGFSAATAVAAITGGVQVQACIGTALCGNAVAVQRSMEGQRSMNLASSSALTVVLEDVRVVGPEINSRRIPAASITPAYGMRVECTGTVVDAPISIAWASGNSPHRGSNGVAAFSVSLNVTCAEVAGLAVSVLRESAWEWESAAAAHAVLNSSATPSFAVFTGDTAVLEVLALDATGRPFANASGATSAPLVELAPWMGRSSNGSAATATAQETSALRVLPGPFWYGQLTVDSRARALAGDIGEQPAAPYVTPSLGDMVALHGAAAGLEPGVRALGQPAATLDVAGQFWTRRAHGGAALIGAVAAQVRGADVIRVTAGGNLSASATAFTVPPLSLAPPAIAVLAYSRARVTLACTGGSGRHSFALEGVPVRGAGATGGSVLLQVDESRAARGPGEPSWLRLNPSEAGGPGAVAVTCGDDIVAGAGVAGKDAVRAIVHVAHVAALTVTSSEYLGLGVTSPLRVSVLAAGGVPFAPDQYAALNLTIDAVDAVTGARIGSLAVGGAPVSTPGAPVLIAERVSALTGEHEFVLMGSAVSDRAVVLTASASNCKPGSTSASALDCWSVTSTPLSVSVYSSIKAFPPFLVLLPSAELLLHLSGGPSSTTGIVSRVRSTADAAVATVTSDGRVTARGVGSTTISVRLMREERVVGSVDVPVTVAVPTAISITTGQQDKEAAPSGLAVIVAGTTLQLSWRTPEGHTPTSLSGLEAGVVQAEWTLLHDAAVVSALPWPSVDSASAFNLAPRFAHESAGARGLGALLTATPDAAGAVHTTVGLSVRMAGLLFRSSLDVAAIPQLRIAYPALLSSTTALLPAGTSTPVRTNLDALWASGGGAPSRHLAVASPPSEGRAALACGSVPRGSPPLHKAVVLEDRLASGTHAAFALVPTQRLSLILECARLEDVKLKAVAGSEGGVDSGADLVLGYGTTHALEVIGVDADGRPFGIGLGSLCPSSQKANASCAPSDLGLRTFVSAPATVGMALEVSGTAGGRGAVLLRINGSTVGSASVLAYSNWGARGAATAGDSIVVSVRGDVLPAGLTTLLPFGEVDFSIADEALARVGLGTPLEVLRASVRWSTSNAAVAAEVPSLPSLHKAKRGRPAAATRPGRVVAFAPGSAVITASVSVRGSMTVLGSATVRVVLPASVSASFARVTLDDLEAGATGANAREVGHSFALSDAGMSGGPVGMLVTPPVPGAEPAPALFVLRLRARVDESGQQVQLTEDSSRVRQRVRFACGVSSGEWFRTAQVGPGAAVPALMAWSPPPLATFDKGWAGWEEASAEGGTQELLAAAQTWPEASRHERLCAILPVTGVSGMPLPDALTSAAPPMPPPASLTLHARLVTLDRAGEDAVAPVALQPATVEAAFKPALRLLPLALARTLLASGNAAAGWGPVPKALPLRSYAGAPPASADEVLLLPPSVGRPLPSVVLSAAAPFTAFLYGLPACSGSEGGSQPCAPLLSSDASRLEVRLLLVEGGAVRGGWVQPSTAEALAALCAVPDTCPAAMLSVGVAPHLLDAVSRGGRGNSFADSPLVVTVEDAGGKWMTQNLALSCAFDDGSGIALTHAEEEEAVAEAPAAARSAVCPSGPSLLARLAAAWGRTPWASTVALVLLGAAAVASAWTFTSAPPPPPPGAEPTQPTLVAAGGFVAAEARMAVADLGASTTNAPSAAGWHGGAARAGLFSPARRRFA